MARRNSPFDRLDKAACTTHRKAVFAALLSLLLTSSPQPEFDSPQTAPISSPTPLRTVAFETEHFRFVASERAFQPARALALDLEGLRAEVVARIGRDWSGRTEVRVALGRAEYEALALAGSRPPGWAVALAWPEANVILVDALTLATPDGKTTLRHELVHIALGRFAAQWPRWFQEGVAQMVTQERQFRSQHFSTMAMAVATDRLYRFDVLSDGFPEFPADVEVAYAQSAEFVSFLFARHGSERFGTLIELVGQGRSFEESFGRAFHASISTEEAEFKRDVAFRYPWWPVLLGSGSLLWGGLSVLMVVAFVRRRRTITSLRAEQKRVEHLEDTAVVLLNAFPLARNDDGNVGRHFENEAPWRVTSVLTRR
jgi:hypothetical protein